MKRGEATNPPNTKENESPVTAKAKFNLSPASSKVKKLGFATLRKNKRSSSFIRMTVETNPLVGSKFFMLTADELKIQLPTFADLAHLNLEVPFSMTLESALNKFIIDPQCITKLTCTVNESKGLPSISPEKLEAILWKLTQLKHISVSGPESYVGRIGRLSDTLETLNIELHSDDSMGTTSYNLNRSSLQFCSYVVKGNLEEPYRHYLLFLVYNPAAKRKSGALTIELGLFIQKGHEEEFSYYIEELGLILLASLPSPPFALRILTAQAIFERPSANGFLGFINIKLAKLQRTHELQLFYQALLDSNMMQYSRCKLVLVGEAGAGKTWTKNNLAHIAFNKKERRSTNGLDATSVITVQTNSKSSGKWSSRVEEPHKMFVDEFSESILQQHAKGQFQLPANDASEEKKNILSESDAIIEDQVVSLSPDVGNLFERALERLQTSPRNKLNSSLTVSSKSMKFSLWDFGGQKIFHNFQNLFLTPNSIILLVFNLRNFETNTTAQSTTLDFWLKSIELYAPSSKVVLVGTHLDQLKDNMSPLNFLNGGNREKRLKSISSVLSQHDHVRGNSVLWRDVSFFPIDNYSAGKNKQDIRVLRSHIYKLSYSEQYGEVVTKNIPLTWIMLVEILSTRHSYLTAEKLQQECKIWSVDTTRLIGFFTDAGVFLHFNILSDRPPYQGKEIIFLQPMPLVKILNKLIFEPAVHNLEFKIPHQSLAKEFSIFKNTGTLTKKLFFFLMEEFSYNVEERRFMEELLFSLLLVCRYAKKYFVPAMSKTDTKEILETFLMNAERERYLEIRFNPLLPRGFFPSLICLFMSICYTVKAPQEHFTLTPTRFNFFFSCYRDVISVYLVASDSTIQLYLGKGDYYSWAFSLVLKWLEQSLKSLLTVSKAKPDCTIHGVSENMDNKEINIVEERERFFEKCRGLDDIQDIQAAAQESLSYFFVDPRELPTGKNQVLDTKEYEFDVFLSHAWGDVVEGRHPDHDSVDVFYKKLVKEGIKPWFDSVNMKVDLMGDMIHGIRHSRYIFIFLTYGYLKRLELDSPVRFEFNLLKAKQSEKIVFICIEEGLLESEEWKYSRAHGQYAGNRIIDFSSRVFTKKEMSQLADLVKPSRIRNISSKATN
eukprot:snap_masked-scaffold_1-processed-gene-23.39-mRNA-1 protein AED:1.00 eAED:1.00 QI:0/0/0/0/1/1/4/0/1117